MEESIFDYKEDSLVCPHGPEKSPNINLAPELKPAPIPQKNKWENRKGTSDAEVAAKLIPTPPKQMPNSLLGGPLSSYYNCLKIAMVFKP